MPAPGTMPCQPWATEADLCDPCYGDYDGERTATMLDVASRILYELSGRQWGGECETTVRPCTRSAGGTHLVGRGHMPGPFVPIGNQVADSFGFCGCGEPDSCGCGGISQVRLKAPVVEVLEVLVDGDVLDPSLYRVDDYRWLVRRPDPDGRRRAWPCCQRLELDADQPHTFQVSYVHGRTPPPDGVLAAGVLACELLKSCTPGMGECRLPKRVQTITRQGVTMAMIDPMDFVREGRTGLIEVDLFLQAARTGGSPGAVMSPDLPPFGRLAGT